MACAIGRQPYGCLLHFIVAARGPAPPPSWNISSGCADGFPRVPSRLARRASAPALPTFPAWCHFASKYQVRPRSPSICPI